MGKGMILAKAWHGWRAKHSLTSHINRLRSKDMHARESLEQSLPWSLFA